MIDYVRRHRIVRRDDQQLLQRLLIDFERSQTGDGRGDHAVRAAVLAIARAASLPASPVHVVDDQRFLDARTQADDVSQWVWIRGVTSYAERIGNIDLVAHAALFTFFFVAVMAPSFGKFEHAEMRLAVPAEPVCAAIYSAGLRILPRTDPDRIVVWHDDDNSMRVEDVLRGCAFEGLKIQHLLDPNVVPLARRVMGVGGRRS